MGFVKRFEGGFLIFLFFGERGKRGREWEEVNVNWGFEGAMGGIKVEFGGFIGGFGKIFFTNGGIKREKEGVWRWEGEVIFF